MFETAKTFEKLMDTVFRALYFMDHYLSVHYVDQVTLQRIRIICMWTAIKYYERRTILLEEMALVCECKFSREQMVDVEVELVSDLGFRLSPLNLFTLARDFVHELPLVMKTTNEWLRTLQYSTAPLAKAAVQLVAKSEYDLTVPKVLQALEFIKIKENSYRAAFKIVRGIYFASSPKVLEAVKVLTRSPTSVEQVSLIRDEDVDNKESSSSSTIDLFCTETLSPSPSLASPVPVIQAASTLSNLGVTNTTSSPAPSKPHWWSGWPNFVAWTVVPTEPGLPTNEGGPPVVL
ncbi:hypothetical protein PsorP6_002578 [Peronosclerospora sorghi]|uniref:Uncharacterized protein n=1 Tax=Peronosclerospora sorghi TaxID=230839 RepID=A0ACC0WR17_9STRA|nr:hypothetical protein PsorP6_002578 [Peronosclerospora sorghi]